MHGPQAFKVRIKGKPQLARIVHVSRETLNHPSSSTSELLRHERRERRKRRMRLRKLRGWR